MTNIYFWGKPISRSIEKSLRQSDINCIQTEKLIQQVSCGQSHAVFLTENNQLYALGSNQQGQCGAGYLKEIPILKILLPIRSKIVSISCGWNHTLILDQVGCLYTSGSGNDGAIGQGSRQNSYNFKQIMTSVRKISAGMDHSLALKGTKVFGWGNNDFGQLGMHSRKSFLTPQQLNIYPCDQICAGVKFSIFITIKGVFGCGLNHTYQLGLGNDRTISYPKCLNIDEELERVYYGNYTLGRSKLGNWYVWGSGAFGVFKYPTKANFFQGCDDVSMGLSFGLMMKNDKIYMWGSNNYGELLNDYGEDVREYVYQSPELTSLRLTQFSCGTNFAIGISHEPIQLNDSNNYGIRSDLQEKSRMGKRYSNNKLKKSAFTAANTDLLNANNGEMRSIYSLHQYGREGQQHPKSLYSKGASKTNVRRQRSFIQGNINQRSHQDSYKALSDHAVHKRKVLSKTEPYNGYQQKLYSLHQNKKQRGSKGQKYEIQRNKRELYTKLMRQQDQHNKEIKFTKKSQQNKQFKYETDQNSSEDPQINKQNYHNIEKLRNAIQRHKMNKQDQQSNLNNQYFSSQHQPNNQKNSKQSMLQTQINRQQFISYGQNLQRLRELLEEAKAEKQSSYSSEHQY